MVNEFRTIYFRVLNKVFVSKCYKVSKIRHEGSESQQERCWVLIETPEKGSKVQRLKLCVYNNKDKFMEVPVV